MFPYGEIGHLFFHGKKKGGGVSVTGAALNTGREEQISWNEIRSLSGHRFRQVNSSSGDIYHQTYCFAATGSGAGEGGGISLKASHNKLSYPPVKSKE